VLFATGYSDTGGPQPERPDPDAELLTKPFTCETLMRKVGQILAAPAVVARPRTGTG
jgi:hypothetical protein